MQYYRCKCGELNLSTSMGSPWDCEGCEKCKTTFAKRPEDHKELQPHNWITKYNGNTGKPYKECKDCMHIDFISYNESKQ